ncbi:MAG: Spermidine/spermine N(1)-acetyltransferase [Steroidobacteraceae bacterium]|nr:Spermidine/spermine N(1)-acetyltransferase [Steroidobacteraceae bacterium]
MTRTITIRRATIADAFRLGEIGGTTFTETFGHLYPPEDLAAFLRSAHSPEVWHRRLQESHIAVWLVEVDDGVCAGYASAGPCKLPVPDLESNAGELFQLYVRGPFHGRRLGSRLLTAALAWLESRGFDPLYIGVWSRNESAQRLYARFGFTRYAEYEFPVGTQRDHEYILRRA